MEDFNLHLELTKIVKLFLSQLISVMIRMKYEKQLGSLLNSEIILKNL